MPFDDLKSWLTGTKLSLSKNKNKDRRTVHRPPPPNKPDPRSRLTGPGPRARAQRAIRSPSLARLPHPDPPQSPARGPTSNAAAPPVSVSRDGMRRGTAGTGPRGRDAASACRCRLQLDPLHPRAFHDGWGPLVRTHQSLLVKRVTARYKRTVPFPTDPRPNSASSSSPPLGAPTSPPPPPPPPPLAHGLLLAAPPAKPYPPPRSTRERERP